MGNKWKPFTVLTDTIRVQQQQIFISKEGVLSAMIQADIH